MGYESDPRAVLEPLFRRAQEIDEFEYCCALLRVRGMEGPGWDPTVESLELVEQLVSLIHAPLDQRLVFRLTLFLYSHVTEMADLYDVPMNMLRIIAGHRYTMTPFQGVPKHKTSTGSPLTERVMQLASSAEASGWTQLADLYRFFFVRQVRNAFFHSDYALGELTFNMKHGEPLGYEGVLQKEIPYEWLLPRLETGINTTLALLSLLHDEPRRYVSNKIVKGRMGHGGSTVDVELIADPSLGLQGFRSPPTGAPPPSAA